MDAAFIPVWIHPMQSTGRTWTARFRSGRRTCNPLSDFTHAMQGTVPPFRDHERPSCMWSARIAKAACLAVGMLAVIRPRYSPDTVCCPLAATMKMGCVLRLMPFTLDLHPSHEVFSLVSLRRLCWSLSIWPKDAAGQLQHRKMFRRTIFGTDSTSKSH